MSEEVFVPEAEEQLDQLQSEDTLINRGVDDILDEGLIAPDHWSVLQTYGNTADEMRRGEPIDQQIAAEEPEVMGESLMWRPEPGQSGQVGNRRAGRLAASGADFTGSDDDTMAVDCGIDGGGATAEEAAMHVIDPSDDLDYVE
ncbi:MAG: DUF5709 domain-containing protein [Propionibacteriaceae bacterium]|jgi:hypothetical protein|nr:DUF5709 domain-containing protein [Propionibacteriaceae bacterium]